MKKLFACVLLAACSGSTEPEPAALQVGTYTYQSGLGAGTLTLTYATPDSVAGRFDVGNLRGPFSLGRWNVDAYPLFADEVVTIAGTSIRTTYNHRISATVCQFKAVPSSEPWRACTLTYVGP